jgi:hypothetical protein
MFIPPPASLKTTGWYRKLPVPVTVSSQIRGKPLLKERIYTMSLNS